MRSVPTASANFLKYILEIVFCEGVQHRLRFFLHHLSCVKMVVFRVCHQSGKKRKVGWLGGDSRVTFSQNSLVEEGKVRCRDATRRGEVLANFHAIAVKRQNSMWN
jgi:hypothetical protein